MHYVETGEADRYIFKNLRSISKGGTRGLEVLSLAECRNIYDTGITNLKKCK